MRKISIEVAVVFLILILTINVSFAIEICEPVNKNLELSRIQKVEVYDLYDYEYHDMYEIADIQFLYALLGIESYDQTPLTIKKYAEIIMSDYKLDYQNYEYYRSIVISYATRDMLKCICDGYLSVDSTGKIDANRVLHKYEVLWYLNAPKVPERPKYVVYPIIPIVMYHEINDMPKDGPDGLYVSREKFKKQLSALTEHGYHTISMEQLYQYYINSEPLPSKPVVLTFDDGYKSHFNFASVELAKRGMTGTFYIITNVIDDGVRSPSELKRMYDDGMEIGSHTASHLDARGASKSELKKEYSASKNKLESAICSEVRHFCYPIGAVTNTALDILKETGYVTAVTTQYGKSNKSDEILQLKRIRANYYDSTAGFLEKLK